MELYCPFPRPLVEGRLVRRHKRFLADVELDGRVVTAHCANSGSMLGMRREGSPVQVLDVAHPRRKLAWSLEMVHAGGWVGCNTMRPNAAVEWAIGHGLVPGVGPGELRREVPYGKNSRIDLLVGDHHVEVKNTTLARPPPGDGDGDDPRLDAPAGTALFPDAVTARGAKHMRELAAVAAAGRPATVVFFVNRGDCDRFAVARRIDPAYAQAFDAARGAGVQMVPLGMDVSPEGWRVRGPLPVVG